MINCVMLIDDSDNDLFLHSASIKRSGLVNEIITMKNGSLAIEYLKTMKSKKVITPDIVFVDINMPVMNGWEFLTEYNKLPKELKGRELIVMLTSEKEIDNISKVKSLNVTDYITKPLTVDLFKGIAAKLKSGSK